MPEFQNWWVVIKETFYKVSIPLLQPWNKQICLFKPFVSLLLSYPLVCLILIFYFKTLIQISFLIFTAKLMLINPPYFRIIWQKCHNILLFITLFPFYSLHIYPSVDFLGKYLLLRVQKNFFHGRWEAIYFFHGEERYKK